MADDEVALAAELSRFLERSGFEVAVARDGHEALRVTETFRPDLIILDILMPGLNGREVCRRLRAAGNWTPVVMLTQVGTSAERAMSLEEGADDYLNKPFDPLELVARIGAIGRRVRAGAQTLAGARRLGSGLLSVDRLSRRAFLGARELTLTTRAFAVLEHLMLRHGEILGREHLLNVIWGWNEPVPTRAVDIRVAELRKALQDDARDAVYIETVVGEGYRFVAPVEVRA